MSSDYERPFFKNTNIFSKNQPTTKSYFGASSKLENLENLYFHFNPYAKTPALKSNQQLKERSRFSNNNPSLKTDINENDKYGQINRNNYKRFHFKVEELKSGKKFDGQNPYSKSVIRDNPTMAFHSVADLATLHPLTYQKIQSIKRLNNSCNIKTNMRIQMVEEKMRKLEDKNDELQIINNIFFDSLKDTLIQSLKRKAFIKRHLKDIEYLKKINIDEYNEQVEYIKSIVENGDINFDNYDDEGNPIEDKEDVEKKMEAMKTEIGTLLSKGAMQNDAHINILKRDVDKIKQDLEDKLLELDLANGKNFKILEDYLCKEEQDRLEEKQRKLELEKYEFDRLNNMFTEVKNEDMHFDAIKKQEKKKKKKKYSETEDSEVSSETSKKLTVVEKMFLDSVSMTLSNSENTKSINNSGLRMTKSFGENKSSSKDTNDKIISEVASLKSKVKNTLDITEDVILNTSRIKKNTKENLNEKTKNNDGESQKKSRKSRTKSKKNEKNSTKSSKKSSQKNSQKSGQKNSRKKSEKSKTDTETITEEKENEEVTDKEENADKDKD